ncbi:MAG: VWA domain-containing protein [Streptosporangiales bacterium]|nr:VWA domain-containing protein [Streptosporangiales bacterium]
MTVTEGAAPQVCGRLGDEHGSLPLVAVAIEGDIRDLVATTVVKQTFRNTRTTGIEATYVFPLPDRAGVTSFVADLAGRVVEGRLDERGKAREEYDQALAAGHRAAIAEEDRPGVFTIRVGNLQPGEEAVVTLTLTGPLPVEDQAAEYRFPLVVAPRYVAGTPIDGPGVGGGVVSDTDRVPDASRVTPPVLLPGQEGPVRLSLRATLRVAGLRADQLTSTLHDADVTAVDDGIEVALRPGERLDRDVVLRWPIAADRVRTSGLLAADDGGPGGTWQVTVVPPELPAAQRPRDVVVVLDRSGSMGGWKIVAARRAAARIVDSLGTADRFAVLAFDNEVVQPPGEPGLRAGTDRQRWAAVSWLGELEARGGTEMLAPLREAVRVLGTEPAGERERYVVLVTDGQVAGEDEVLRVLAPAAGTTRVFTLGIDRAVNAGFLRRIAAIGAGRCDLVDSEDRLDNVLAGLHRRICPPLATGLTVTADGVALLPEETTPGRAPDLFPGVPITLAGRVAAMPAGEVRLTVRGAGMADETVPAVPTANVAVRTGWARARVRDLEDAYAAHRGDDALAERIVATSLDHRVLSRFTAFVAVDRSRVTESGAQPVVQPVELPSGWQQPGGPQPMAAALAAPMAAAGPAGAVPRSVRAGSRKAESVEPPLDAYQDRLTRLLDRLAAGESSASLLAELDELLDDLASIGAPETWLAPLRELAAALRSGERVEPAITSVRELTRTHRPQRRAAFWRS